MASAPRASAQHEHDWAVALVDGVLARAGQEGVRVSVAIVDHRGDPIQQDSMDGAPTAAAFVAVAVAAAAATFQLPSERIADRYGVALPSLQEVLPYATLAVPGGAPLQEGGTFIGGIGVAGVEPVLAARLAAEAAR
jgi:uncharacterized protein GlcG (DUF336 family)